MKCIRFELKYLFQILVCFVVVFAFFGTVRGGLLQRIVSVPTVQAEEEDGEGDEGEEEDREEERRTTTVSSGTQTTVVYEKRLVQKKVQVTPPEYTMDTDGDGLVDGLDPDPKVAQQEYFTDTDGDGVPNAFDRHHDGDDWAYVEDTDANGNGVLDGYEYGYAMGKK